MDKKQIEEYMKKHEEEMISDLMVLCRIDSEKMSEKPGMPFGKGPYLALSSALAMARGYGFKTTNYDNFAGAVDLNDQEHVLDILAHLDVVPAQEGWTETEAFKPVIKEGKIYGRGTSDDKGPAIAALYALRAVKELGIPLKKSARLILGTNEESGSRCIAHYYEKEKEAPMTFSPDGDYPVVNIEKGRLPGDFFAGWKFSGEKPEIYSVTGGKIENAVPSSAEAILLGMEESSILPQAEQVSEETGVNFTFEKNGEKITIAAHGVNSHASEPEHGKNALTALLLLLTKLPFAESSTGARLIRNLYGLMPYGETDGLHLGIRAEDEESGALTVAFSQLTVTEGRLDGLFDCRFPIGVDADQMLTVLTEKFKTAGLCFNGKHCSLPHYVSPDSAFVKELLSVYEDYTGLEGKCIAIGGGTYVHNLKNGVAFGAVYPGKDTHMHGADEYAVISQLTASACMFAQVIADLCG